MELRAGTEAARRPQEPSVGGEPAAAPAVAFVINRTRVRDPDQFAHACRAAALARGWAPMFLPTTREDHGEGLARHAVTAGAQLVFAVGGDGTVRACASVLAGTGVRLAIVPRGTANLAARALRVPRRLRAALATGFGDHETVLDLGLADETPFTAMAGIGLDAAVVEATRRLLKLRLGWIAYAEAGLAHLSGAPSEFTVRLDDGPPLRRAARCVVVGNAGLLPGGFPLLPDARPDDGLLDVGILAPASLAGWVRIGYRVLTRSRRDDHRLERYRARKVEITADKQLPREADGEIIAPAKKLVVNLRPQSLIVRTPRPWSQPPQVTAGYGWLRRARPTGPAIRGGPGGRPPDGGCLELTFRAGSGPGGIVVPGGDCDGVVSGIGLALVVLGPGGGADHLLGAGHLGGGGPGRLGPPGPQRAGRARRPGWAQRATRTPGAGEPAAAGRPGGGPGPAARDRGNRR